MDNYKTINNNNIASKSSINFFKESPRKKTNNNFEKKIFKIISYIYYYEKEIKEILSKENKDFYLINYDWIIEFKKIFEYDNYKKIFSKRKNEINFNDLDKNLEQLYKNFVNKNIKIVVKEKDEYIKLTKVNDFIPAQYRAGELKSKSASYYIIPSEIKEKIKNCFFEKEKLNVNPTGSLSLVENKIIIKNKNIINFGNLDNSFKLTLKYIFNYFSDEIANSEINYLIKDDIKDYINQRGCRPDNYETQILKIKDSGNTYKEIGRLNIIKNIEIKKEKIKNVIKRKSNICQNVEYYTKGNSPIKNEIIQTPNNNMIKNRPKIKLNLVNNLKNRINIKNNKINEREKYSSQTYINIKNVSDNREIQKIKEDKIKEDEEDKIKILEKNMNEKFSNLSKLIKDDFSKMRNYLDEKYKTIINKYDEMINYNRILNEKFDKLKKEDEIKSEQSQNKIKQLSEEINISKDKIKEYKNIIQQKEIQEENNKKKIEELNKEIDILKQKNKIFEEEKEKNQKQNEIINDINIEENLKINTFLNSINTNLVLQKIKEIKSIKLIGLKNLGQTSFINSVLQCLLQTKPLINYFKNTNININNNLKLASAFQDLINQMSSTNERSLNPVNLIKTLMEINNSKNINTFDSIYNFLESILNKLHDELKNQNNNSIIDNRLNKLSKFEFESFKKQIKNEKSIITDLFQGVNEEVIQCLNKISNFGENSIFKFNPFLSLSFNLNNIKSEQNIIKIFDCFLNMKREQNFNKEEICHICDKNCPLSHRTRILLCPEILIIMLNYDNEYNNNDIKVNFEEKLNITNFTVFEKEKKKKNMISFIVLMALLQKSKII